MSLNEYEESLKRININLSDEALEIINKDILEFMNDDKKFPSTFLNNIFENFYEDSNASLVTKSIIYEKKLKKILKKSIEIDEIISTLKNVYIDELIDEIKLNKEKSKTKYRKEIKFKLNNNNYDILTKSKDVKHSFYKGKNRLYLNALFEEYATLTSSDREMIYFKQFIDKINVACIVRKCMINITTKNNKTISINPYKIYTDSINTSAYLVGTTSWNNNMFIIRLKNIVNITLEKNSEINKENFEDIDNLIKERGIANASGSIIETKIKLTTEGIKMYNITLNMRPKAKLIDNDIYTFSTSEFQIIKYFFPFGKEATIISPIELKEKFKNSYREAIEAYK